MTYCGVESCLFMTIYSVLGVQSTDSRSLLGVFESCILGMDSRNRLNTDSLRDITVQQEFKTALEESLLPGTLTNGTTISKSPDVQQLHQKRTRCPTVGEECSSSHKRMLQNGSADEKVPFVSAYIADDVPAAAAVVSSSTANLLTAASVGSLSSAALEPSENLCEIIKNSIVETAVSH